MQSISTNYDLNIILSGFPVSSEENACQNEYVVIELARKVIQILGELINFLKNFINIYGGGNKVGESSDGEEEIFQNTVLENDKSKNENLKKNLLDLNTAIKFLDSDIYDNNVEGFNNIIHNIDSDEYEEYKKKKNNEDLEEFFKYIGIDKDIEDLKSKSTAVISIGNNEGEEENDESD